MTSIFFDLDGTLLDTRAGIAEAIQVALSRAGFDAASPSEIQHCFGPPIRHSFARLTGIDEPQHIERLVTLFRQHYLQTGIHNYQVYPGIKDLLERLKELDIVLRVLTVKPQQQAEWLLEHSRIGPVFSSVHGSKNNGERSDKTLHLEDLLQRFPHPSGEHWMVGDRASDINAARACRIHSVAVRWGYGDSSELATCGSDFTISRPEHLVSLLTSR